MRGPKKTWNEVIRSGLREKKASKDRRVTREGWGGVGLPCPFSKLGKSVLILEKCPDCGHLWVTFLILNAIFTSFQEKKLEIFLCRVSLCRVLHCCLSKCTNSKKTPLP